METEAPIAANPFALRFVGPAPDGALDMTAICRTSRNAGPRNTHAITVGADWSVTVPHDLALERIAAAMGGYLSCIELVDRLVPALCDLIQRQARRVVPEMSRNVGGRWTLGRLPIGCGCEKFGYGSAADAAEHVRSTKHVAQLHGVAPRDLERLLEPVYDAHDTRFLASPPDIWGARAAVREDRGLDQLWDAGLHPATIAMMHREVRPDGPPLPVWFYLGAVSRRPNLDWIAQTLRTVPDEDIAVWLCWTNAQLDHVHPEARTGWIQAGVPRQAIAALADGAYSPIDVARLAAATRRSVPAAALTLAAWHRARCHPTPEDIALLDELDADPWYEPSIGAVDWLCNRVSSRNGPTRTEIGLVLAVCGTRAGAMKVLAQGIRDPRGAARVMNVNTNERRMAHQ